MIRKLMMFGLVLMILSATTLVFAEEVVVTKSGAKYHKEICRLIKNRDNTTKLEKEEAVEQGYGPCKRCYKEDVVSQEDNQ